MPYYIMHHLPNGINGLLITAIFAAAMSSMDSGINAVTTVILNDFKDNQLNKVLKARYITALLGLFATSIAFYVSSIGGLIEAFYTFMGLFSAPILALFLLGVFNKNAKFSDWLIGLILAIPVTLWLQNVVKVHWVWFFPCSFITSFGVSYVVSSFSSKNQTA